MARKKSSRVRDENPLDACLRKAKEASGGLTKLTAEEKKIAYYLVTDLLLSFGDAATVAAVQALSKILKIKSKPDSPGSIRKKILATCLIAKDVKVHSSTKLKSIVTVLTEIKIEDHQRGHYNLLVDIWNRLVPEIKALYCLACFQSRKSTGDSLSDDSSSSREETGSYYDDMNLNDAIDECFPSGELSAESLVDDAENAAYTGIEFIVRDEIVEFCKKIESFKKTPSNSKAKASRDHHSKEELNLIQRKYDLKRAMELLEHFATLYLAETLEEPVIASWIRSPPATAAIATDPSILEAYQQAYRLSGGSDMGWKEIVSKSAAENRIMESKLKEARVVNNSEKKKTEPFAQALSTDLEDNLEKKSTIADSEVDHSASETESEGKKVGPSTAVKKTESLKKRSRHLNQLFDDPIKSFDAKFVSPAKKPRSAPPPISHSKSSSKVPPKSPDSFSSFARGSTVESDKRQRVEWARDAVEKLEEGMRLEIGGGPTSNRIDWAAINNWGREVFEKYGKTNAQLKDKWRNVELARARLAKKGGVVPK